MIFGRKTLGSAPVHYGHRLYLRLCLAGALAMLFLFGGQYDVHDYYVIAPWYPLLAYALLGAICRLYKTSFFAGNSMRIGVVIMAALMLFFAAGYVRIYQRLHHETRFLTAQDPVLWMQGGAAFLQKNGVPQEAQIMVLGDDAPNTGLVYFDGKALPNEHCAGHCADARAENTDAGVQYGNASAASKRQDETLRQLHVLDIENGKAALLLNAQ